MDPTNNNILDNNQPLSDAVNEESATIKKVGGKNIKKTVISIFGLLALVASVGVGVSMMQQRTQSTKVSAGGATLTLTSNNPSPKVGDTIIVAVSMNTNGLSVTGLDLTLKYDSNKLTPVSIQPGTFLPYVFIDGTIDNSAETANIVLGCPINSNTGPQPVTGTGLVAQVAFLVKTVGTHSISFDPNTKVSASGQTTNVAGTMSSLLVTVIQPTAPPRTPSPSPVPLKCNYSCSVTTGSTQCAVGLNCYITSTSTTTGYCRNPSCTSSSNCNCPTTNPTPTPVVVNCNQTCSIAVGNTKCASGLTCYSTTSSTSGVSAYGLCRNPSCTSSTSCGCGSSTPSPTMDPYNRCTGANGTACVYNCNTCTAGGACTLMACKYTDGLCQNNVCVLKPTPIPQVCGGIQGLTCPSGYQCVYSSGSTKAPYPDASGTCQPAPSTKPTPVVVSCNQTCNPTVNPPINCATGQTCYTTSNLAGASGVCRNTSCTSKTNCICGTPTPSPIMCGGIQGLACPSGYNCVYSNGSTKPPYPDASGTCTIYTRTSTPTPTKSPSPTPVGYCTGTGSCTTTFCPTMPPCPTGSMCAQVMPPCVTINGTCVNNVCKSPTPTPTKSPSPTPNKVGDVNKDGVVNIVDIGIIIDSYNDNPLTDKRADLNNDGVANIIDIGIVVDYYEF